MTSTPRDEDDALHLALHEFVDWYVPTHIQKVEWLPIACAIRAATAATSPTIESAAKTIRVLASFGAWLLGEGQTVNVGSLSEPALIERYSQVGLSGVPDSTRSTQRSILRRVARRLDPAPQAIPEPIRYRRAKAPYKGWELAGLFEQAAAQPTVARRRAVQGLLLLGSACGLDRTDLAWVRGRDVNANGRDDVVVTVCGGSRPRRVVALNAYAASLLEAAAYSGKNLLIGGSTLGRHNVTTPALDRMVADSRLPRLSTSRLRSTWLVRHLDLATPLSVLLPAAGLKSSRTLDDLLEHTNPIPELRADEMLRGASA